VNELERLASRPGRDALTRAVAEGYARMGRWGKAAGYFEALAEKEPDNQIYLNRLLDCYSSQGDYEAIIAKLEPLAAAAGKNNSSYNMYSDRLVNAYQQAGRHKQAIAELEKLYKSNPENLSYKQRIGDIYMQLGEYKKAKQEFRQLLKAAGDDEMYKNMAKTQIQMIEDRQEK